MVGGPGRGDGLNVGMSVRFHGRGGQGVVTSAELLSVAAFHEGRHAQAIPSFGSERMGAPVVAFCRVADRPIRTREPVVSPGAVVVGDVTLVHHVDLFEGLVDEGFVLVNTTRPLDDLALAEELGPARRVSFAAVGATELARRHVGRPVPNAALLGGLCALTNVVSLGALVHALESRFEPALAAANAAAASAAYDEVMASSTGRTDVWGRMPVLHGDHGR